MKKIRYQKISLPIFGLSLVFLLFQNTAFETYETAYNGGGRTLSSIVDASPGTTNNKRVEILPNEVVYIDKNIEVDSLIINGRLHCVPNSNSEFEIKASTIQVNGLFQCGTATNNFEGKLKISLKDSSISRSLHSFKGLIVGSNGRLILSGGTQKSKWMRISKTTARNDRTVEVEESVRGQWQIGDEIVIAPSSYNYYESETFFIISISSDGRTIGLDKNIEFQHWGETQSISTPKGRRVVLDQRAEIANLTRHIVIQSENPDNNPTLEASEIGGHVMVNSGGRAYINSVEFYKMGQAGIMARYPFHWHMVGNANGQFIKNSSIHKSFQRCITIHKTNETSVLNNVCSDFKGHGFFLEDGDEVNNTLSYNLGINARQPSADKILLASDNPNAALSGVQLQRFPATSAFWISNPQNTVVHNVAAGSIGTGFWMAYAGYIRRFDRSTGKFTSEILATPATTNTTAFNNNTAHSTVVGITWDGAPQFGSDHTTVFHMNNPLNNMDRKLIATHYTPPVVPIYNNLVAFKNTQTGIYYRGQTAIFNNALVADNGLSFFLAFNQIVKNSIVVGRSDYHTTVEENYLYGSRRFLKNQSGVVLYDGPFEFDNVEFMGFSPSKQTYSSRGVEYDITPTPFFKIGGARKYTNIVRGLSFSPEPYYKTHYRTASWLDEKNSSDLRDKDGSLTGIAGALLIPENDFNEHPNCVSGKTSPGKASFSGFKVCSPNVARVSFSLYTDLSNKIPFIMIRNDSKMSLETSEFNLLSQMKTSAGDPFNNKVSLFAGNDYEYTMLIRPEDRDYIGLRNLKVSLNAEVANRLSPIIRIAGYGSQCRMLGTTAVYTLDALRAFNGNGYYSDGNIFYIKLKTLVKNTRVVNKNYNSGMTSDSESSLDPFIISCSAPNQKSVIGSIAKPVISSDNLTATISGWACAYNMPNSIPVHLYAGNAADHGGQFIIAGVANLASEPAVAAACATGTFAHRFKIELNQKLLKLANGRSIYVHGLSPNGGLNLKIAKSGSYNFPMPIKTNIIGYVDGFKPTLTGGKIFGWACNQNMNAPVDVHIFLNGAAGQGQRFGTAKANIRAEAAVGQRCATQGAHRFELHITTAQMNLHKGKTIFAHGISLVNGGNPLLTNSGKHKIP